MTGKEILAIFGGSSVVAVGAIAYLGRLFLIKWQAVNDKSLESFRSAVSNNSSLLSTAISNLLQSNQEIIQKRIDAVEVLWASYKSIKDFTNKSIVFFDLLKPSEYNDVFRDKNIQNIYPGYSMKDFSKLSQKSDDVEKVRPFLGEEEWRNYFSIQSFLLRINLVLSSGYSEKNITSWRSDAYLQQIIASLINEDERNSVVKDYRLNELFSFIEQKFIFNINRLLSGELVAEYNIEKIKDYINIVNNNTVKK